MNTRMVVLDDAGVRTLGLAVLRQAVDDIRFRPYREPRHRCCPFAPERCAHRFLANGQSELWCDLVGLDAGQIRYRLKQRLALS